MATQKTGGGLSPAFVSRMNKLAEAASCGDAAVVAHWQAHTKNPKKINNLNNLNLNSGSNLSHGIASSDQGFIEEINLNNLNRHSEKNKSGLTRLQLITDPTLKRLLDWGVQEWLIYVCVREYGLYRVKAEANRIYNIPDAYFQARYGSIEKQRGVFFNKGMQKLKEQKQS